MTIIGAASGDVITVSRNETGPNGVLYISSGEAAISSCGPVTITAETF